MSVDPSKSNALPQADPGRCGPTSAAHSDRHPTVERMQKHAAPTADDRVRLSAASRSLVDRPDEANRVPVGAVSPERMLEVLRRLRQGYYSSAHVQDKVANAVRQDLGHKDGVITP